MAIDASIALGIKPIQIENPLNNMVKFANIRNDMQTNQMNQLTMAEAARKQAQAAQYRNALSNLGDPSSEGYEERRAQAYYNNADPAGLQAIRTSELANQKMQGEIQVQKEELAARVSRDLSRSSTNANVTAWFEESMDSHVFKPQEKVAITNEYGKIMAIPEGPERAAYLRSKGQSAAEAKDSIIQQDAGGNANIYSVSSNTARAPKLVSSTKKTLTPDQALNVSVGYDEGSVSLQAKNDSLKAKLAELNAPGTTPERAKALEGEIQQDRRSISAQQQDQESIRRADQQAKQPRQEFENLLRDRAALVAKGTPKNDPVVAGMTARINYLTTHQGNEPVDLRKVANTVPGESGSIDQFNIYGQKIGHYEGVAKPSAQFIKTREQTKTLGKNLDLAIAELENATKDGGLIDQSTGSGLGKLANTTRGFITGGASKGAIAGAKLAPIADLGLKMVPRFEGPQSDKDTQSYKEASGQLADTSIPNEIRKDAGKTVLRLLKARKGQFVTPEMAAQGEAPAGGIAPPAGFVAD